MWVKGVLSQQKETSQISVLEVSCVESPQAVRSGLGKQWALDNWVTLGDWSDSHGAWLKHSTRSEGNRNLSSCSQARRWFQYQAARKHEVVGSVLL